MRRHILGGMGLMALGMCLAIAGCQRGQTPQKQDPGEAPGENMDRNTQPSPEKSAPSNQPAPANQPAPSNQPAPAKQ